jgi:hypothetical protein
MLKKYKQTGKILSVHQLKEVKGGTQQGGMFAQPCEETEDCYGNCEPGRVRGTFCSGGICRLFYCQ